jgi:AcrR family transcriptional regulator
MWGGGMAAGAREDLLAAGLAVFDRDGFDGATVAAIRARARASNGSFFHFFASKKELAGTLFLEVLQRYHTAILAAIDVPTSAEDGIGRLIHAHLNWVADNRREARSALSLRNLAQRMDRGGSRGATQPEHPPG